MWKFIFFFVNNAIDFHRHAQIVQNKFIGFVYLLAKRTFIFLFIKKVNSFCSAESGTLNAHGHAGLNAGVRWLLETGIDTLRQKELDLMWAFYEGVREIPEITVYGDFSARERCPIVSLNVQDYDSSQVSDALFSQYGIATRPGAHCAPLMHDALGTGSRGGVRFSFSHYNTMEEIKIAIAALREIAREE